MKKNFPLFLIFAASVILSLVLSETILRLTPLARDQQKVILRTQKFAGHCYNTNPTGYFREIKTGTSPVLDNLISRGFKYCVLYDRDKRRQGYFPGRSRNVVFIGDSFVFGEGLYDEDTVAYIMEQRLPALNFRNYGGPGWDIDLISQELLHVLSLDKKPQAVVYFYTLNDAIKSAELKEREGRIHDLVNIVWNKKDPDGSGGGVAFLEKSILWRLFRKAGLYRKATAQTIDYYNDIYFSPANEPAVKLTFEFLKAMKSDLASRGIRFGIVFNPIYYKKDGHYPLEPIHSFLMDFCRQEKIACFDAAQAFKDFGSLKRFTLHPIDYHPNGLANRRIVDYLLSQEEFVKILAND